MNNKLPKIAVAIALALALAGRAQAQMAATLTDLGATSPTPGLDDASQLANAEANPPGLNYYFDNNPPPGQTFTTGTNPNGYLWNTLALELGNNFGNLPAGGEAYLLRIYSVANGTNAVLLAAYTSQNNFLIAPPDDWVQWSGLGIALAPNTQYAYTFARTTGGYCLMGNTNGDAYAGGQVVTIPTGGGVMQFSTTNVYDAAFDAGLSVASTLTVNPPAIAPTSVVTNGATVTLTAGAAGPGPIGYQWKTDGGSGGTLTNIPAANGASLTVNTTWLALGGYQYAVVATNSSMTVTSSVATLVVYQAGAATLTDAGSTVTPGVYDINQLAGGGAGDGLSYYDNAPYNGYPAPGQTFTTGTNGQGYYLSSVTIGTGGGTHSGEGTAAPYGLHLYKIQGGTNAVLLYDFTSQGFAYTYGDWLSWNGFMPLVLKPNTTYAYAFQVYATQWWQYQGMASSPTNSDLYAGGVICAIPPQGGPVTYGASGNSDAAFSLGILPVGQVTTPIPSAISISPNGPQPAGTLITLSSTASGAQPITYQWQTDGGSGSALTNIPAANATNLMLNTAGWVPGTYRFDVAAANSFGTTTSGVATVVITYANGPALLTDIGTATPMPANAPDIFQTLTDGTFSPPGLNYYIDNIPVPGQTFVTGNNPGGYTLTTLAVKTAGNGNLPAGGQPYVLRLYTVSGNSATLYATYTSGTFIFAQTDWLRWSGLTVPLQSNATYAYSFGRPGSGSGWEAMASTSGNPYVGGQVATVPPAGGNLTYSSATGEDATFALGLALAGHPNVTPPSFSPTNVVYAGSPVTLSASVTGTGPFTYQWQTDGGSGGSLTNIPGATNLIQTMSTTGLDGLNVSYALVAANANGATTGEAGSLLVNPASAPVLVTDLPPTVSTFVGGTITLSAAFTGTQPITYQWQLASTNLVGQTNATLVLANVQVGNSGSYTLIASNVLSTASSSPASVSVWPQLAAATAPFTVNFQFRNNLGGDPGAYTGPGVSGYGTGTFWNTVYGPNFVTANNNYTSQNGLADDGVTDTHISWTLMPASSYSWPDVSGIALLGSPGSAYSTPQPFSFTLPGGRYNVILFSAAGSASANGGNPNTAAAFTINGVTHNAISSTDTSFVQGNNYVVFTNVTVSGTALNGTWAQLNGYPNFGSLNGAQLQYVGPPAPTLSIHPIGGGQLQLQWSAGTLLEATNLLGPWTTNAATSPYTVTPAPATPQKFYRVRNP